MPKKEINYQNTIIYKIQHIEKEDLIYVGHTTDFNERKHSHKKNVNSTTGSKYKIKVYQMIRDNGGWDMFRMLEVLKFSCNDRREADAQEDKIMRELKANMNSKHSIHDKENTKEYNMKYKAMNREIINKKKAEFYKLNKVSINEKQCSKCLCECGSYYSRSNKCVHLRSKKHLDYLEKKV